MRAAALAPAVLALAVAAGACSAAAADVEVEALVSPGGTPFLHAPMPDAPSVSMRVAWPSAWAYDEAAAPAAPYVGGDLMLAGGAGELSPAEVQQRFEDLQAEGTLFAEPDHLQGVLNVPVAGLDEAVRLAGLALAEPAFDERWFERLRDGLGANVAENEGVSGTRVGNALVRLVLGDSPPAEFLTLAPASLVAEVTLDDVERWHERTLTRRGATVVVAGAVDADAAGRAVDALLGALPEGEGAAPSPAPTVDTDFGARTVLLHDPAAEVSVVALAGRLPPLSEGAEIEDVALTMALAGGEDAPLMQALRTRLRAAYGADAVLDAKTRALRLLVLYAEVDPDKVAEARDALRAAYADFLRDGPSDERVRAIGRRLAEAVGEQMSSPAGLSQAVLESVLAGHGPDRAAGILDEEIPALDAAGLRERLGSAWPAADALIDVVLSADADAIDGACVVESLDELAGCGPE